MGGGGGHANLNDRKARAGCVSAVGAGSGLIWNFYSYHLAFYSLSFFFCLGDGSTDVALLFYVHGKHLRSCRDGQLT